MVSLERRFDERLVAALAAAEKQVQQSYRPVIAVHKWFARRPGTLFRALALSEFVDAPLNQSFFEPHDLDGVVLDPFMGGGTTLFESNRLGLGVAGYDTNPMSHWVCERELEDLEVDLFEQAGEAVCQSVEEQLGDLYLTHCEECGEQAPVKFFLWVKTHECACGHDTLLFNGPLVAGRGMKRHTHDVLVCGACHAVDQFLPGKEPDDCPACSTAYAASKVPATSSCECGREFKVPGSGRTEPMKHTLFALEYQCEACKHRDGRRGRFFKGADAEDHERYAKAAEQRAHLTSPFWPEDPIPHGDETKRLHRWGYNCWSDLHNPRQLLGLHLLAQEIAEQPEQLQPALHTVFSDFLRYQNMICRYDTAALKVLDVFSVHGFPINRVQCESALIGIPKVGSGGYRHFLAKYASAKRYCQHPYETIQGKPKRRLVVHGEKISAAFVTGAERLSEPRAALLKTASVAVDPLPAGSVDAVFTDPPYFANVQYSELMDFCYAWLRRLDPHAAQMQTATSRSDDEVTGNQHGARGIEHFAEALSGVYTAAANALKPGRVFTFTYHHNNPLSYAALVCAVLDAGLVPSAALVCPSEMRGSIHINNTSSSRVDTVFVLRKPPAQIADDNLSVEQRLSGAVRRLEDAELTVTVGDQRTMRFGYIAFDAMRVLLPAWERELPVEERLEIARAAIRGRLPQAEPDVPAEPLAAAG